MSKTYDQTTGELCEKCGWSMKFPDEPCRCELERENAALRADKERLDWLQSKKETSFNPPARHRLPIIDWPLETSLRATIDAFRKETQP